MVECAAHQQSSRDSEGNEDVTKVDLVNETEEDSHEYAVEENKEYVEELFEYNVSDSMLDMSDDYCRIIPADSPTKIDDTCLQDETYKSDEEEEWFEFSSEDNTDWQNIECVQTSKCLHENMYVPLPVHSTTEDLPSKEDNECLTATLHPEQDLLVQQGYSQEEDSDKENMSQGAQGAYPEDQTLNEYDEEPVLIDSTEDNVYIIFENRIENTEKEKKPFIPHNQATPEASLTSTIASGTSYISQEARADDDENVLHGELDEYPDEGNDHEHDEEPSIVASTEDDVYIVFETSIKDKQRGQTYFISHSLAPPEVTSNSTIESGASYIGQEARADDDENVLHGELDEYGMSEGNDHEPDEEPSIFASTEDDVYIVFETSIKDKQRGQTSFISHSLAPPEVTSNSTIESGASYIGQAEGRDENFSTQLFWDECEDNEEDPYSLIYSEDELYIEIPFETADEENPRGKQSFIVHRAPAPAPRPEATGPDIEDSYISRVFRQKEEEEKKIYSTGHYQDKVHLAKHEPQIPAQQYALTGQDELILLQEKVKMGIISMDEALQKFQQWQTEKSGLDRLQKKKLQQLRDNIIGDKTDDEKVYDKITIVHQPNALPGKKKTNYGMLENTIYQMPNKPPNVSSPHHPIKKDNETAGKLPHTK